MKTSRTILGIFALVWLIACGDSSTSPNSFRSTDTITLGMLAPKSGELAEWGRQMERSAQFAIQEINKAGGLDGREFKLIVTDTHGDSALAVKAAQAFVKQGVLAILGPGTSSEAVDVLAASTRAAKMPMISPGATSPELSKPDDDGTFFRTIASDAFQGKVLARRIYQAGGRTLGLIYRDDPYGAGLKDTIESEFKSLGGKLGAAVSYPEDKVMNFGTEVETLLPKAMLPDSVALLSFHEDGANITRDIQALGLATLPKFYGVDGIYSEEFAQAGAAKVVNGLIGTASVADTDDPNFIKTSKAFGDLTGAISDFDGGSYDAVYVAAYALAAAKELTAAGILAQANKVTRPDGKNPVVINAQEWAKGSAAAEKGEDIDYNGASGPIDLDDAGDPSHGFFVIWKATVNGDKVSVDAVDSIAFP